MDHQDGAPDSPVSPTFSTFSFGSRQARPVHLVLIVHGLWGTVAHLQALQSHLLATDKARRAKLADPSQEPELRILCPVSNSWTHTYDGIEYCAARVVAELLAEIDRLAHPEGDDDTPEIVTHFSAVGYSLGGLITRYALGLLRVRKREWWDSVEKVQFTTFASPWVGIPKYEGFVATVVWYVGSHLLSRSGRQLYLIDDHGPLPAMPDGVDAGDAPKGSAPLLAHLAHPGSPFIAALHDFRKLVCMVNAVQDRTVPYPTAAFEKEDWFAEAKRLMFLQRRAKGWRRDLGWKAEQDYEREFAEVVGEARWGGTKVSAQFHRHGDALAEGPHRNLEEAAPPMISSVQLVARDPIPPPPRPLRRSLYATIYQRTPGLLRPSAYPFPPPLNFVAVLLSPILVPGFVCYICLSFAWQSFQSGQRIRQMQTATQLLRTKRRSGKRGPDAEADREVNAEVATLLMLDGNHPHPLEDAFDKLTSKATEATASSLGVDGDVSSGGLQDEPGLRRRRHSSGNLSQHAPTAPRKAPRLVRVLSKGTGYATPPLADPFRDGGMSRPRKKQNPFSEGFQITRLEGEEHDGTKANGSAPHAPEGAVYADGRFQHPKEGGSAQTAEADGFPDFFHDPKASAEALRRTGLSKLQQQMIDWLNDDPASRAGEGEEAKRKGGIGGKVEKRLAYLNKVRNSHGAIIYRADGLSDPGGKVIVERWAEDHLYI